jgi:hypothetical protein
MQQSKQPLFFLRVNLKMEDSFHQPKPKAYKPQGQVHFINKLAAMLQSRGAWDSLPAKEVNRSNSAPPMQFVCIID